MVDEIPQCMSTLKGFPKTLVLDPAVPVKSTGEDRPGTRREGKEEETASSGCSKLGNHSFGMLLNGFKIPGS